MNRPVAVAHSLVDKHGNLAARGVFASRAGLQRSTLLMTDPFGQAGPHPKPDMEVDITASPSLPGVRILLVEDEPLIGMATQVALEESGAVVRWARTDRAAYETLDADWIPELLVTDINLGEGTTGFDVSRYARKLHRDLPVIYLTGEVREPRSLFAVEGAAFLTKPVSQAVLLAAAAAFCGPAEQIDGQPEILRCQLPSGE